MDYIYNLTVKKSTIEKFIYTVLIFLSSISAMQFPNFYWFYLIFIIGIFIITYYLFQKRKNIKDILLKKEFKIASMFIITELCVAIYSYLIMSFSPNSYLMDGSFSRTISIFIYLTITIIEAFCVVDYFGKKTAVRLTLLGIISNYILSIIISIIGCNFNLSIIINYLSGENVIGNNIILEAHELAPCFASGIIFLLMSNTFHKKEKNIFLFILSIFIILCGKRIITFSLILIVLFYFIYVKFLSRFRIKIFPILSYIEILLSYFYVYIIKSGIFFKIVYSLGINTMQRDTLYRAMDNYYKFSPAFLGKGSGFTSKWLDNNWMNINIYGAHSALGLHNDFLRHYIELGFLGFLAYLTSLLLIIPYKIKQYFGIKSTIKYVFLFAFQLICWTVDQITGYYIFQFVFFVMLLSSLEKN
ncbi:MAG: O-antigen ligase family protein [Erysipelotrichaceae bacterium]|nr:O-antigen ligase family protein [Erysipelotrichaceae bacterium]